MALNDDPFQMKTTMSCSPLYKICTRIPSSVIEVSIKRYVGKAVWGVGCACSTEGGAYLFVALEQDDAAALVSSCEIVARVVKLDGGDDIRCGDVSANVHATKGIAHVVSTG